LSPCGYRALAGMRRHGDARHLRQRSHFPERRYAAYVIDIDLNDVHHALVDHIDCQRCSTRMASWPMSNSFRSRTVAICAFLLSCRSGAGLGHLRDRPGPVGHSRQSAGPTGVPGIIKDRLSTVEEFLFDRGLPYMDGHAGEIFASAQARPRLGREAERGPADCRLCSQMSKPGTLLLIGLNSPRYSAVHRGDRLPARPPVGRGRRFSPRCARYRRIAQPAVGRAWNSTCSGSRGRCSCPWGFLARTPLAA